jgi:hypothetical protein
MVAAFADGARSVLAMSYRQEITPDHRLGRVTAAFWTLINLPLPLGAALTTALAARIHTGPTLVASGIGVAALAFGGLFTAVRTSRQDATASPPDRISVPPPGPTMAA